GSQHTGTLVEEVAVGLPGVTDTAVYLQVFLSGEVERLGGGNAGNGGGQRQFRCLLVHCPGAEVGVGAGQFDFHHDIGEVVFDGLIAGQWAAEGVAIHDVIAAHCAGDVGGADLLEGGQYGSLVDDFFDELGGRISFSQHGDGDILDAQRSHRDEFVE